MGKGAVVSVAAKFHREHFLRVVSMSVEAAKAFAMPDAVKVVRVGQADPSRYKFGASDYLLFATWADYSAWLAQRAVQS